MQLIKADKKETPDITCFCEVKECGKNMFFHKPFELEAINKKGESFTQYFGYGFVCSNIEHFHLRRPYGY